MSVLIQKEEGALLNLICSLGPVAWRRYGIRPLHTWGVRSNAISGAALLNSKGCFKRRDHSIIDYPSLSFRFEPEDEKLIERIREVVTSYRGDVKWVMTEHKRINLPGTNWGICPEEVKNIEAQIIATGAEIVNARDYIALHKPEFVPKAFNDLRGLAKYASRCFGIPLIQEVGDEDALAFDPYGCYDNPELFFSLNGSGIMVLTRDAALDVCHMAAAREKIIWGIESGDWLRTGFDPNWFHWRGPDTSMGKEQAYHNNLEGVECIENKGAVATLILTTRNTSETLGVNSQ
jgi:hypothetical protein